MTLAVEFWGTRGSRPAPASARFASGKYGGNTSCAAVRTELGDLIILDAGTGMAHLGATLTESPCDVLVLVTHTHWDHIQGLPFFDPLFAAGNRVEVRGPRSLTMSFESALAAQMTHDFFPVALEECEAALRVTEVTSAVPFEWRGVRVTPQRMHHPVPTVGYRLDVDNASLVYATDCELGAIIDSNPDEAADLTAWARDTDLLIHDTQYTDSEYAAHKGWGHSSLSDVLRFAERSNARRLAMWHHDPHHSDTDIDSMVDEARARGVVDTFACAEGESTIAGRAPAVG